MLFQPGFLLLYIFLPGLLFTYIFPLSYLWALFFHRRVFVMILINRFLSTQNTLSFLFSTNNILINALRISCNVFDLIHAHHSSSHIDLFYPPTRASVWLPFPLSNPMRLSFHCSNTLGCGAYPGEWLTYWDHTHKENRTSFFVFLIIASYWRNPFVIAFTWKQS